MANLAIKLPDGKVVKIQSLTRGGDSVQLYAGPGEHFSISVDLAAEIANLYKQIIETRAARAGR